MTDFVVVLVFVIVLSLDLLVKFFIFDTPMKRTFCAVMYIVI